MTVFTAFGLHREPFDLAPDAEMYAPTLGHEDGLERLRTTVALGLGLGIVTGATGYGKSMLRLRLLDEIAHHPGLTIGAIDDPTLARTDVPFLREIAARLGIMVSGRTGLDLTTALLRELTAHRDAEERVLLTIDNAHRLASNQLDVLRALLIADSPAPLTILLFGEPELTDKVARKRNLAQRAAITHALNPLNGRDTAALVRHRLTVAGAGGPDRAERLFTDEALAVLHLRSAGVPGQIIAGAAACLDAAVATGVQQVDAERAERTLGSPDAIMVGEGESGAASVRRTASRVVQTSFVAQLDRLDGRAADRRRRPEREDGAAANQAGVSRNGRSAEGRRAAATRRAARPVSTVGDEAR